MSAHEPSDASTPRPAGIPRRLVFVLYPLVFLVGFPLVHGVVPWTVSLLGPWYGWSGGGPALWNLLGLIPVAVGIVVILWSTAPTVSCSRSRMSRPRGDPRAAELERFGL